MLSFRHVFEKPSSVHYTARVRQVSLRVKRSPVTILIHPHLPQIHSNSLSEGNEKKTNCFSHAQKKNDHSDRIKTERKVFRAGLSCWTTQLNRATLSGNRTDAVLPTVRALNSPGVAGRFSASTKSVNIVSEYRSGLKYTVAYAGNGFVWFTKFVFCFG